MKYCLFSRSDEATSKVSGTKHGVDEVLKELGRLLASSGWNQSSATGYTDPRSSYPH